MISTDQFAHSDPTDIYKQMRPDQWTAIANEFLRVLKVAGDSQADRFAGEVAPAGQQTTSPPVLKTLDQAVAVHMYTRDHYPELFAEVARHPVTVASLQTPGTPAETEAADISVGPELGPNSFVDMETFVPEAPADSPSMGYPESTAGGLEPPHEGGRLPYRNGLDALREPQGDGRTENDW